MDAIQQFPSVFTRCKMNDDTKDCLCSALSINCLQMGCYIHKCPRCGDCPHLFHDWMTKLTAVSPEKKLRDLVIPGSHDSASVTISKSAPFSAVGLCQNVPVHEQLWRGARYLDLRVGGKKKSGLIDDTFICHGMLKGSPFPNIIDEIRHFIRDNYAEFVIVEVIYDPNKHGMSPEQQLRILQLLASTFDRRITHEDASTWFDLTKVTLGDLAEKQKNVLVLINDGMYRDFSFEGTKYDLATIVREFGCHKNEHFMNNQWHNTCHVQTLLERNVAYLKEKGGESKTFLNSQFVLTPQPPGGVMDALKLLSGLKSLRPVSLARQLYEKEWMETFIRDNAEDKWNIVLLDFLDLCPQMIRFLIGLNSEKHLSIHKAAVKPRDGGTEIDVIKEIKKLRKRKNCIYLLDFQEDLGISIDEGTLKLRVQFDDEEIKDLVIPFDHSTEYLLCDVICDL